MDLQDIIDGVAVYIGRSYALVDSEDVAQELWLWLSEHSEKLEQWEQEGEAGIGKLVVSLRRAGRAYAQKEQEARAELGVGGDTSTVY
jgi:hypothetical protein